MCVPFKYQFKSEGANEHEDVTVKLLKDLGLFLNCALQFGEPWKPMVSLTVLSSFS